MDEESETANVHYDWVSKSKDDPRNEDFFKELDLLRQKQKNKRPTEDIKTHVKVQTTDDGKDMDEMIKKENEFFWNQSVEKASRRMEENRALPIDHILSVFSSRKYAYSVNENPIVLINKLDQKELECFAHDIKEVIELIGDYWPRMFLNNILHVVYHKLETQSKDEIDRQISEHIQKILKESMERDLLIASSLVEKKIKEICNTQRKEDLEYWESVYKEVRNTYTQLTCAILYYERRISTTERSNTTKRHKIGNQEICIKDLTLKDVITSKFDTLGDERNSYKSKDNQELLGQQHKDTPISKSHGNEHGDKEDEEGFSNEVDLGDDSGDLPKPKYQNKVCMGYKWNRYNQAHYDIDNPPPKTVYGYKFKIFYPYLKINIPRDDIGYGGYTGRKSYDYPTFILCEDPEDKDSQIIKFLAGSKYRDIAFRIVKNEWEYSYRKGFRSYFENGTMHLNFSFKRQRYRR